jgi:hypothetical protein
MQTKFRIVETEDYILAVSNEGPETGDLFLHKTNRDCSIHLCIDRPAKQNVIGDDNVDYFLGNCKKIAGYKPKNNTPELDLPLLPDMVVEDDVEKLAKVSAEKEGYGSNDRWDYINGYTKCYESTTKTYSEEDIRKAFKAGMDYQEGGVILYPDEEGYIQSLKQPTPTWFVAEIEEGFVNEFGDFSVSMNSLQGNVKRTKRLKTTIINGKEYLVGEYTND